MNGSQHEPLRVLFATPEYAPLIKTGGLADVSASLPQALARLGIDMRVLLPGYGAVLQAVRQARELAILPGVGAFPAARILAAEGPGAMPLLVLDCPRLYLRSGGPYLDESGQDWPDNALRFGLLSRVAALLGSEAGPLPWKAQIVHCNDWQTGLAPAYLAFAQGARAASLITIHNLAYQGIFAPGYVARLGLPASSFSPEGAEYYGQLCFLKAALHYAGAITTVSPTYAREIQTEALGFGMHGLLARRNDVLTGILNGVDTDLWNPSTDPRIPRHYDSRTLAAKHDNKRALQAAMGLPAADAIPLLAMVSRLAHQKGVDLVIDIAAALVDLPAQLVIQGVGDAALERQLHVLAAEHPGKIAVHIGFDENLAHLIEAGADLFLMPSRFEPCGMNQMYSQRYGTPPVAHATGGLVDSIVDCNATTLADATASGFLFHDESAAGLLGAIRRALEVYRTPRVWRALQRAGMTKDFSWGASAAKYLEIYRAIAAR